MSIYSLQQRELLPYGFKYIGFAIAGLCVLYAFTHHFIKANLFFDGLHWANMVFVGSLIVILSSREPAEDERANQIRTYVHSISYGFLIGLILVDGLGADIGPLTVALSVVLTTQVLIFHLINYFDSSWVETNRGKVWSMLVITMVVLLVSFRFLWVV